MKILVFAAHPDDAETTVGGSICRYTDAGHAVHVVNMTNNGTVRVDCAARASRTMGCTCEFLDFADLGIRDDNQREFGIAVDQPHLEVVDDVLRRHRPDLVWAHWPVDTHADHIAAGSLALRACDNIRLYGDWQPELWFFGPAYGYQSLCFHPDHFEDITPYVERKKQAVGEYEVVDIWACWPIHETMDKFFGYASGYLYAEAFSRCHFRVGEPRFRVMGDGIT